MDVFNRGRDPVDSNGIESTRVESNGTASNESDCNQAGTDIMHSMRLPIYKINVEELRTMTKPERGEAVSRKVGSKLCHRIPRWAFENGEEMRETLLLLIGDMRERLHEEGVHGELVDHPNASSIPTRSRRDATYLAALITYVIPFVEEPEEQFRLVDEGIDWARVAGDTLQEGILYYTRAGIHIMVHRSAEIITNYRLGIDAAVRGDHPPLELSLRSALIDWILSQSRAEGIEEDIARISDIADEIPDPEERGYYRSLALRFRGSVRLIHDDLSGGITLLQKARTELIDESRYPHEIGPILFKLAGAYNALGQTQRAIDLLLDMVEISIGNEELVPAIHAYARIGELHLQIGEIERSQEAFTLAERYLSLVSLNDAEHIVRMRRLPLYLKTGEYEEGIALALQLVRYFRNAPRTCHKILHTLGMLQEGAGDLESAEESLRRGYEMVEGQGDRRIGIGYALARVMRARGKGEDARLLLLGLVETDAPIHTDSKNLVDCLDLLAAIEEERKDYPAAVAHLRRGGELRSEIERTEREALRRNAQISADLRIQESEKGMERIVRHRAELELAEVLTGLQKSYGSLARIEKKIVDGLDWLPTGEIRRVVTLLKEAITEPEAEGAISTVSAEFNALGQLTGVDQSFFDNLDERRPNLTTSQKQLCGMIRAGLQTPEIAGLLEITHNAVWKKRKRLRKKMNLEEDENLEEVIGGIV